jgi:hypothetical protein
MEFIKVYFSLVNPLVLYQSLLGQYRLCMIYNNMVMEKNLQRNVLPKGYIIRQFVNFSYHYDINITYLQIFRVWYEYN